MSATKNAENSKPGVDTTGLHPTGEGVGVDNTMLGGAKPREESTSTSSGERFASRGFSETRGTNAIGNSYSKTLENAKVGGWSDSSAVDFRAANENTGESRNCLFVCNALLVAG